MVAASAEFELLSEPVVILTDEADKNRGHELVFFRVKIVFT